MKQFACIINKVAICYNGSGFIEKKTNSGKTRYLNIKDPNKSNTQKYFRHFNVKRYDLALLRSGYFFYFGRLLYIILWLEYGFIVNRSLWIAARNSRVCGY